MKFDPSPAGQRFARKVMEAVREAALHPDDPRGERVLLFGLRWTKIEPGHYVALDLDRGVKYVVLRSDSSGKSWRAVYVPGKCEKPVMLDALAPTFRAAKTTCEEHARKPMR